MKRLLPLAAGIVALAIVAVVTTVAVGAGSDGSAKSARETDDAGDAPVAAVCAPDVPDCDDMIVVGEDEPMNICIAPDSPGAADDPVAAPECNDVLSSSQSCAYPLPNGAECIDVCRVRTSVEADCPEGWPTEPGIAIDPICVDDGSGQCVDDGRGGPPSGPSTTYELTIAFNASVTQTDIDETTKVITSISPDIEFLVRESFPPVGAARVTTDMLSFCPDLEAKLESTSYVDNVTCVASGSSTNPSYPDAPVSSEPGSAE